MNPTIPALSAERRGGAFRARLQRLSLRRGLLLLVLAAMLPMALLSLAQGVMRLERDRTLISQRLSDNAVAAAGTEQNVVAGAQAVLRMLSVNPSVVNGGPGCASLLGGLLPEFPAYNNFTVIDRAGDIVCSALPMTRRHHARDQRWWPAIRSAGRFVVGAPVASQFNGRRVLAAVLPRRDAAGRFAGATMLSIDLVRLDRSLRARYVGRDAVVAVVTGDGRPVLASRAEALPAFRLGARPGTVLQDRDARGRVWSYAVAPLVRADAAGNRGLYIAYAAPQAELFTATWFHAGIDFLLPFLSILFACLAIWMGTDRLVLRWLTTLRALATEFARGEYRARAIDFAPAPAEMRSVAASLYRMAHAVEERDATLTASLERQRTLAREVHHRVKNNLQIVMSLLSLQAGRLQDGDARRALELARNRISALALVHRLLYETDEAAMISARRLLGEVAGQLQMVYRPPAGVRLVGEFADVPLAIDAAVPLTLWLVETLSNAFLYAFPPGRSGTVRIALEETPERLRLSVADDGIGFDAAAKRAARPVSNGLRLITAIGQQLGGSATIDAREGGGTRVELDFPRPELREIRPPA